MNQQKRRCYWCGVCIEGLLDYEGAICEICSSRNITEAQNRPVPRTRHYWPLIGYSKKKTRGLMSRLRGHNCLECGARLELWTHHWKPNALMVQVTCQSHDRHRYVALVTKNLSIVAIYSDSDWSYVGDTQNRDEIPF